ncbi:hypothetical protein [Cohnella sp. 56]|uniref:hypothetical protein n=1 Tax=Cohnella sp. 56 TaxID=3113722 RepID=UPI0030E87997
MRRSPKQAAVEQAGRMLPGAERREAQALIREEFASELAPDSRLTAGGRRPNRSKRG